MQMARSCHTRMHNRGVCIMYMYVHGTPHQRGRAWCELRDADYAAHMRLQLVLWRMCLLRRAVHVQGPYVLMI